MKKALQVFILIFTINVTFAQVTAFPPTPLILCDVNNPGDQMEIFDLTSKIPEIIGGQTNVVVTFHPSSGAALSGIMAYTNTTAFQNTVNPEIVFVRVENVNNSNDWEVTTLELIVPLIPVVIQNPDDIFIFEGDGDGFATFDLTINEGQALGGQDPFLFNFYYYVTQADADAMVNPIANPESYINATNPQIIYGRMDNLQEMCYFETYTFQIETDGVLGINSFSEENLQMFPNPASSLLNFQFQLFDSEVAITIFDVQGKLLFSETKTSQNSIITLDVSSLHQGMYFVELSLEGNRIVKKLMVNR